MKSFLLLVFLSLNISTISFCNGTLGSRFFFFTGSGSEFNGIIEAPYSLQNTFDSVSDLVISNQQDTLKESQILYNGREWKNLYYMVQGDQFLFSNTFLPGSVTIRGKKFINISLKYDIYKDEILIPNDPGGILQINKEMVDSFSVFFQNKTYQFARMPEDKSKGYFNVLYKGKTALYLKYSKYIKKLAVEGAYDKFFQETQTYFVKDNIVYPIAGKNDLINVLIEDKVLIKNFIKKNKIKITRNDPDSFIPVIGYFDTIRK